MHLESEMGEVRDSVSHWRRKGERWRFLFVVTRTAAVLAAEGAGPGGASAGRRMVKCPREFAFGGAYFCERKMHCT